jgi:hypothetical protein
MKPSSTLAHAPCPHCRRRRIVVTLSGRTVLRAHSPRPPSTYDTGRAATDRCPGSHAPVRDTDVSTDLGAGRPATS